MDSGYDPSLTASNTLEDSNLKESTTNSRLFSEDSCFTSGFSDCMYTSYNSVKKSEGERKCVRSSTADSINQVSSSYCTHVYIEH